MYDKKLHPLYGTDLAAIKMCFASPDEAPRELKAKIVEAGRYHGRNSVPFDVMLEHVRRVAKKCGYTIDLVRGDKKERLTGLESGVSIRSIMEQVADRHGVSVQEIVSQARPKTISDARLEFYYRCRAEKHVPYKEIGEACGQRDHTTVIAGIKKYAKVNNLEVPR